MTHATAETPAVRRQEVSDITDADILEAADPELDPALFDQAARALDADGGPVALDVPPSNPDVDADGDATVYDDGQVIRGLQAHRGSRLLVGEGDELADFTNTLAGGKKNHQLVRVYDCQGREVPVQRAKLKMYLTKRCGTHFGEHRAFYRNRQVTPATPQLGCLSTRTQCRKRFFDEIQQLSHFQTKHSKEYQDRERMRQIRRDEKSEELAEQNAELLQRLVDNQSPEALPKRKQKSGPDPDEPLPPGLPGPKWKRHQLIKYMRVCGMPRPQEVLQLKNPELLAHILDAIEKESDDD